MEKELMYRYVMWMMMNVQECVEAMGEDDRHIVTANMTVESDLEKAGVFAISLFSFVSL
jgi:hypothetical protein